LGKKVGGKFACLGEGVSLLKEINTLKKNENFLK